LLILTKCPYDQSASGFKPNFHRNYDKKTKNSENIYL
jgi:hypothetical protein